MLLILLISYCCLILHSIFVWAFFCLFSYTQCQCAYFTIFFPIILWIYSKIFIFLVTAPRKFHKTHFLIPKKRLLFTGLPVNNKNKSALRTLSQFTTFIAQLLFRARSCASIPEGFLFHRTHFPMKQKERLSAASQQRNALFLMKNLYDLLQHLLCIQALCNHHCQLFHFRRLFRLHCRFYRNLRL